jgi:hypothetical protein
VNSLSTSSSLQLLVSARLQPSSLLHIGHIPCCDNTSRFQVFTAASMKMTAFGDIAPCSLVEADRRFRGAYCLHRQGGWWRQYAPSTRPHDAISQKAVIFTAYSFLWESEVIIVYSAKLWMRIDRNMRSNTGVLTICGRVSPEYIEQMFTSTKMIYFYVILDTLSYKPKSSNEMGGW